MKKKFQTTIVRDGSMCFIPIPFDPKSVFGKARPPVKVTLNGYSYRSTIAQMGDGPCLPLRKSHREAAGLEGGETLPVTLELDEEARVVEPPKDLVKALKAAPPAWDRWKELSFTHQREHAEAIEEAKKPETRARRIEAAVKMILARPPKKAAAKEPSSTAQTKKAATKKPATKNAAKAPSAELVRYAALLRGVMPTNCKMPLLKAAFEQAGFEDVRTVISSGNVVFSGPAASDAAIEERCEAAMAKYMDRSFLTIVRRVDELEAFLDEDPFAPFGLGPEYKLNVTFRKTRGQSARKLDLPMEVQGAKILAERDGEILTAHIPYTGAAFMALIEKTYGKEITTRTRETVARLAK